MSKFIKDCLIIGGILTAVGIGVCAFSWTRGLADDGFGIVREFYDPFYDEEDWFEKQEPQDDPVVLPDESEVLAEDNLVPAESQMSQVEEELTQDIEEYLTEDITAELDAAYQGVQKMDLEVSGAVLRVVPAEEGDQVRVLIGEGPGQYECYQEEETLKVRAWRQARSWKQGREQGRRIIELQVPKGLSLKEMDIEVNGGILIVKELDARELEADVNGGIAKIFQVLAEDVSLEMNAGTFVLTGDIGKKAEVSCNAGEAMLILDGKQEDYGVECDSAAGVVNIGGDTWETYTGQHKIGKDRARQLKLDCVAGEITVDFQED